MNSAGSHFRGDGTTLWEIGLLFLKLGTIAFGGPAAHIGLMEQEVVRRRGWLTHAEFLDLLAATNLIPGPNSTELAIHIGHRRGGRRGMVVAGVCFIVPAMLIVMGCAWAYVRFGTRPEATALLYGVKPVIIAVVVQALWGLGRSSLKTMGMAVLAVVAAVLGFLGVNELAVLFGCGALLLLVQAGTRAGAGSVAAGAVLPTVPLGGFSVAPLAVAATAGAATVPFGLWPMFVFFLKVGSVLFGSGYVLLAFLRADLVERWGWLTEGQLFDAVAVGQITPGPVFTSATFIGYVLGGPAGAVIATIGIFLPAFFFVGISGPLVPRLRRSPLAGAFLDGVVVASLALMAVVTWHLATAALIDGLTLGLATASTVVLVRYQLNSAWLVLGGAAAGLLFG